MAEFRLQAGASVDLLTKPELDSSLAGAFDQAEAARLRGIKHMRLPRTLTGAASGGTLALGESDGQICGPRSGYIWSIRRLVVTGLTSGVTPDVVNLYHGTAAGPILWQFNGNNFGYTFGRLEMTLYGGENLALASVGTFSATGQITLSGEILEVPAELIGKLV